MSNTTPGTVTVFSEAAQTDGMYIYYGTLNNGLGVECKVIADKPLGKTTLTPDDVIKLPETLATRLSYKVKPGHETVGAYDAGTLAI